MKLFPNFGPIFLRHRQKQEARIIIFSSISFPLDDGSVKFKAEATRSDETDEAGGNRYLRPMDARPANRLLIDVDIRRLTTQLLHRRSQAAPTW